MKKWEWFSFPSHIESATVNFHEKLVVCEFFSDNLKIVYLKQGKYANCFWVMNWWTFQATAVKLILSVNSPSLFMPIVKHFLSLHVKRKISEKYWLEYLLIIFLFGNYRQDWHWLPVKLLKWMLINCNY